MDIFASRGGTTGGGKIPILGTKKNPGALYGYAGDMWAALSAAVCWHMFTVKDKTSHLSRL
jgi:hypothetical protein